MSQSSGKTLVAAAAAVPPMNCNILVERCVFWDGNDRLP